jgi:hypothetical protein
MEYLRGTSDLSGTPQKVDMPESRLDIRLVSAIVATLVLLWLAPKEFQKPLITASLLGILGLIWPIRISKQTDDTTTEHYLHRTVWLARDF